MNQSFLIGAAVAFPILYGAFLLLFPGIRKRKTLITVTAAGLGIATLLGLLVITDGDAQLEVLRFGENLKICFRVDNIGRVFAAITMLVWPLAGVYSFEYMKHETEEKRYFGFYTIVYGVILALCFSGNLITFYMFFEMMTLTSFPLVLHSKTKEAMLGQQMLGKVDESLAGISGREGLLLVMAFFMILGFGVKAGMFPMHAWLPSAHPVAPAPASAVMSGLIVKMGVLGIIRAVYYVVGADFLQDTWVQRVWLILSLITVFMGSMLAYREKVMKKRLAYSTVSQISYILFGLALLQPYAMTGSLLHVVFHAVIKSCLFLGAGAIIYKSGRTRVDELTGIGKEMPVTIWCFTFASLALIGIPPASGFISKWYLAVGSLESGIAVFTWLGPVILLVSALLTAGYLLPVAVKGFLPGADFDYRKLKKREPVKLMTVPMVILAALAVLLGVFPNSLIGYLAAIAGSLF